MDSHLPCYDFIKLVRCMRDMLLKLFAYKKKEVYGRSLAVFVNLILAPKLSHLNKWNYLVFPIWYEQRFVKLTSRSWTRALTFLDVSGDGELWDASLISVARKFLHFLTFSCISCWRQQNNSFSIKQTHTHKQQKPQWHHYQISTTKSLCRKWGREEVAL